MRQPTISTLSSVATTFSDRSSASLPSTKASAPLPSPEARVAADNPPARLKATLFACSGNWMSDNSACSWPDSGAASFGFCS
ncbi:hypothetical protein D3C83_100630 [compost metagenome]